MKSGISNRGFASMNPDQQREIARMGGQAIAKDRSRMSEIGRAGGKRSAELRKAAKESASSNA